MTIEGRAPGEETRGNYKGISARKYSKICVRGGGGGGGAEGKRCRQRWRRVGDGGGTLLNEELRVVRRGVREGGDGEEQGHGALGVRGRLHDTAADNLQHSEVSQLLPARELKHNRYPVVRQAQPVRRIIRSQAGAQVPSLDGNCQWGVSRRCADTRCGCSRLVLRRAAAPASGATIRHRAPALQRPRPPARTGAVL